MYYLLTHCFVLKFRTRLLLTEAKTIEYRPFSFIEKLSILSSDKQHETVKLYESILRD